MGRTRAPASRGSIGGASGDAGVEYRRGVAAYAVACGLAGVPLGGLEVPGIDAQVKAVVLETDAEVDDIRVIFNSSWIADIQAKRNLRKGPIFEKAVAQWIEAGRAGVDPDKHRLVIAAGQLSGTMRALRTALNRRRLHSPGSDTKAEAEAFEYLAGLLSDLTSEQRLSVLDAAVIWELAVEEPEHPSAREAVAHLGNAGISIAAGEVGNAWTRLCATAGRLARRRGGYDLAGWLSELRGAGLVVTDTGDNPAGRLETRRFALERYAERLAHEARELDLRALGAELPPLMLEHADAQIQVGIDPDDDRSHGDLLWAFLRRNRVVLTGLPGAGKSTALRQAAGQLAQRLLEEIHGEQPGDPAYPFPVRASLKQINALDGSRSFRDRMIAIAIRDAAAADRDVLTCEIESRLDQGLPIALFLDALDETYDDRATVVAQVHSFLAGLPDSACVLIATRDIAYGQAATLGWADLRLLAPGNIDTVVTAVLCAAAAHQEIATKERAAWVATRRDWVNHVLARDQALKETPLIPTLISLLAVERSPDRLPTRRAELLLAVVNDVMSRHEAPRQGDRPLHNLTGNSIGTAAMHVYAVEATTLLDSGGVATMHQVTDAVQRILASLWALAPGPARAATLDAVRFLDETGVFIVFEPDDTVTARLSLFAEIGDAINAMQHPAQAAEWVNRRIDGRQLEPIILAATLDESINRNWQNQLATRAGDLDLARAMVLAYQEGVSFTEDAMNQLRSELLASIGRGNQDGWSDWSRLLLLGVPTELVERTVEAAAQHSAEHQLLARAAISLHSGATDPSPADDEELLELMSVRNLPRSANEMGAHRGWEGIVINRELAETQLLAATELLRRRTPGAVDAIRLRALDSPSGLTDSLVALLRNQGHHAVADQIKEETTSKLPLGKMFAWLNSNRDAQRYPRFLSLVAEAEHDRITTRQRVELAELGDFVETLNMNDMGVVVLYRQTDEFLRRLIELTCALFGFGRGVLAAEAQVVLDRLEKDESLSTYFSLFDTAEPRFETNWTVVTDPDDAVDVLVDMFSMSLAQARFAARCLWGSTLAAGRAEPILRDLVTHFDDHPRHQYLIAITLASFPTAPDPAAWSGSPNPVLRRVATQLADSVSDGSIAEKFQPFLTDDDGYVREAALEKLAKTDLPDLESVLEQLTTQDRPGWRCQHCATDNPPGSSSCIKDDCHSAGPDPAGKARELLVEVRRNREAYAESTGHPS